jgi:hypothetical protein
MGGFVLIAESLVFMFTGIKPHLYKQYRSEAYKKLIEKYPIPDIDIDPVDKARHDKDSLAADMEAIGGDFEAILGLYPGSPTWKKMASGKIPKSEEFEIMYKRYEDDVTKRVLKRIKNDPVYKTIMKEMAEKNKKVK